MLEYINYATVEQQLDRLRMDLLLKAMKVNLVFTLCSSQGGTVSRSSSRVMGLSAVNSL